MQAKCLYILGKSWLAAKVWVFLFSRQSDWLTFSGDSIFSQSRTPRVRSLVEIFQRLVSHFFEGRILGLFASHIEELMRRDIIGTDQYHVALLSNGPGSRAINNPSETLLHVYHHDRDDGTAQSASLEARLHAGVVAVM